MKRTTKIISIVLGGLLCGWAASGTLVGYWQFEEGTGLTTADSSGLGATGTLQSGTTVPTWQPGKVGSYSLEFNTANSATDANTSRVNVGNPTQLQFSNAMTLAAWVYLDAANTSQGSIVSKMGGSGSRGWRLGNSTASTAWEFAVSVSGSTVITYTTTAGSVTPAVGTWTHVAAVYNGTNQTMAVYVNGLPLSGSANGTVPTVMNVPTTPVAIGGRGSDFSQKWDGKLDEVRIYDEALSDADILTLAQGNVTPLAFTLEPTDQAVVENQPATFTTTFTGSPAFIQWYSNNVAIDGANTLTYSIPSASLGMSGDQYKVQVTNSLYSITSSNATLTVNTDTTLPVIASARALGYSNEVVVTFSEPITLTSAQNTSNYNITNSLGSVVNISTATLSSDGLTVTLITDPLAEGSNYVVVVNGIQDLAATPNTILANSTAPFTHSTLVGHWQFNEGSGTTTADSGIGGFTGTLAGSPLPTWVLGTAGAAALEFPGNANTRVDIGNPAALQLTGPLTLTACAFPDTWTQGRLVTKGGGGGSRGWALNTESDGHWSLQIPADGNTLITCDTDPGTVALGTWTHVAGVYDPNDPGGASMTIYTNGVLAVMRNDFFVPIPMFNPTNISVAIGARSDGTTRWDGKIDDVRIYARALSAAEIAALVPPLFLPPTLAGDQLTLNWIGQGQLQSAPAVTGTYTNITPAPTPPYTITVVPGENKFFRLLAP